jgi:predicted RNA-binding protein (virulence factor B family)
MINEPEKKPLQIGRINRLRVVKHVDFGVYLDGGDYGEILMPAKFVPVPCQVDTYVDVIVYLDSEDLFVATTETPFAFEGELAYLKVVDSNRVGAFLNWGLPKDLLVPFREQKDTMVVGKGYVVYIYFDTASQRLAASSKVYKFIDVDDLPYSIDQEVDLVIGSEFEIGYNVIINKSHVGIIFKNEIFEPVKEGWAVKGFIKKIRKDKKIDVALQITEGRKFDSFAEELLTRLKCEKGFLPFTDKSPPDQIYARFKVSKKVFKNAVGVLYRERYIQIEESGLRLLPRDAAKD